jgi:Ca-activated chloride channel family protein
MKLPSFHTASRSFFLSFAILLSIGFPARSQQTPRYRAEVDQVVVYVSVYDENSQLLTSLNKDEFELYENKVAQTLTSFAQTDVPSSIGIVLDSSGSMRNKMRRVEQAIDLFLSANNPENELFLVRFDDEVELEEDFTKEVEDIRDAIGNIVVKGGTALHDAIYLAVDKVQKGGEPRKVLIVFTDGEDKDSYYTHEELLDRVREEDAQVFVVAFLDETLSKDRGFFGVFKSEREKVQKQITEVAEVTGGKAFFPNEVSELNSIFESIAKELRNQYRLSYISSDTSRDGAWRRIDVRVVDARERGLKVRAKKGYYAPKDS